MATRPARTGQCRGCLGWGTLVQPPYCSPCHQWRSKKANQPGTCRRCQFPALVTPEGLCRSCILAVSEFDAAWYFTPDNRGRCVQLELMVPGLPRRRAVPIGSYRLRSDGRYHPPPWARRQRLEPLFDDPRVCPPAMPGQLMLWYPARTLTTEHAARIRDRPLDGYPEMQKHLSALMAEHGYTQGWKRFADGMIRLALAVRDADGETLISPSMLPGLPQMPDTVGEVARRAGLLDIALTEDLPRRLRFGPAPRHSEPQNCARCLNWGVGSVCRDCARWASGTEGTCPGCGRAGQLEPRAVRVIAEQEAAGLVGQPAVHLQNREPRWNGLLAPVELRHLVTVSPRSALRRRKNDPRADDASCCRRVPERRQPSTPVAASPTTRCDRDPWWART